MADKMIFISSNSDFFCDMIANRSALIKESPMNGAIATNAE